MKPWLLAVANPNRNQARGLAAFVVAIGMPLVSALRAGERARGGGVLRAGRARCRPGAL